MARELCGDLAPPGFVLCLAISRFVPIPEVKQYKLESYDLQEELLGLASLVQRGKFATWVLSHL